MRILITGMPRSGTSYLSNSLAFFGCHFNPKLQAHGPGVRNSRIRLNEPVGFHHDWGRVPFETFHKEANELFAFWDHNNIVIKSHMPIVLQEKLLPYFDKFIICKRNIIDSWEHSARDNEATSKQAIRGFSWFDQSFSDDPILNYGYQLKQQVDNFHLLCNSKDIDYKIFDFNNPKLEDIYRWLGCENDNVIKTMVDMFNGSRFDV